MTRVPTKREVLEAAAARALDRGRTVRREVDANGGGRQIIPRARKGARVVEVVADPVAAAAE